MLAHAGGDKLRSASPSAIWLIKIPSGSAPSGPPKAAQNALLRDVLLRGPNKVSGSAVGVDVVADLPADAQPPESVQKCDRLLHHPAMHAQTRAMLGATAGDYRG